MVQPAKPNTKFGARVPKPKEPDRPSPVSSISKIGSLKRYDDREYAYGLLRELAILVAPVINEYGFKVGTLCEMFPKNANLIGLNVNKGQKILIRLRYASNPRSFYSMGSLVDTFLHELTHNVHGPHDNKFYNYLEDLKTRYIAHSSGMVPTDYRCEESRLGGSNSLMMRQSRLKELSKSTYTAEVRKLGDGAHVTGTSRRSGSTRVVANPALLRQKMLQATERRLRDSKWCSDTVDIKDIEPDDDDIEITDYKDGSESTGFPDSSSNAPPISSPVKSPQKKVSSEFKEIIDLTDEEYELEPVDIIEVDACEQENSNLKSILRNTLVGAKAGSKKVQFSALLPSFDEEAMNEDKTQEEPEEIVSYTSSTSPRAYFGDEALYPRKKLVADLNFDQILKKGEKIKILEDLIKVQDLAPVAKPGPIQAQASAPSKGKYRPKKGLRSKKAKTNSAKANSTKSAPAKKRKEKEQATSASSHKKTVKSINFTDLL